MEAAMPLAAMRRWNIPKIPWSNNFFNDMPRKPLNTVKLGAFVLAGLAFMVLMLYTVGKNRNLFGSNFLLKARFPDASGLTAGNNVRFSGIDAGTVKSVTVLNDTTIEVAMLIKSELRAHIRKNCVASIGTDGLMGNKLLNLSPVSGKAAQAAAGDVLAGKSEAGTDQVIEVLYSTVGELSQAARAIRVSTERINQSKGIWRLLEDESIPQKLSASMERVAAASGHLDGLMADLQTISSDLKQGKGSLGSLLRDTALSAGLLTTEQKLHAVLTQTDSLVVEVQHLARTSGKQLQEGKGVVPTLLNDATLTQRLDRALANLESGTASFDQSMTALQHNFLLRGYFRKQEAKRKKQAAMIDTAAKRPVF
jgi:phospholipid/cholesterol/gamma-HCH transport system substrate-binding protein